MLNLSPFPLRVTGATYKGQKVMCLLKAIRTKEIKHRMCLEARNIADNLYNRYKIAGFLNNSEYKKLLDLFLTFVLQERVDPTQQ